MEWNGIASCMITQYLITELVFFNRIRNLKLYKKTHHKGVPKIFLTTKKLRGYVLLSQGVAPQVPSPLKSLTSVFGMGTGVSSLL